MLVADEGAAVEVREQAGYPTWEMAALVHPRVTCFIPEDSAPGRFVPVPGMPRADCG
jgi:hypothetical protein